MEEETIFLDSCNREWIMGPPPAGPLISETIIILPVLIRSMIPRHILDPSSDYIYSVCIICGKTVGVTGLVCISLCEVKWGVRIACTIHGPEHVFPTQMLITHVQSLLSPTIDRACGISNTVCAVCEHPQCNNEQCKTAESLLYPSRVDELLGQFYRLKLDLISPIVDLCVVCQGQVGSKKWPCQVCKMVFCCKRCKRKGDHVCVPVENVFLI